MRAPLGAPSAASCRRRAALSDPPFRLALALGRGPLRGPKARQASGKPCGQPSASSSQGIVVSPGGAPAPPERVGYVAPRPRAPRLAPSSKRLAKTPSAEPGDLEYSPNTKFVNSADMPARIDSCRRDFFATAGISVFAMRRRTGRLVRAQGVNKISLMAFA